MIILLIRLIILCKNIRIYNTSYNRLPVTSDSSYNNLQPVSTVIDNSYNNNITKSIFINEILNYNVKVINHEICCICLDVVTEPETEPEQIVTVTDTIIYESNKIPESKINVLVKTQCHHIYHKNCLLQWIKYSNKCPLCKINLF